MERLRRRADVDLVFKRGRSCATALAVLRYVGTSGPTRVAVAVGKRLGGAVRRNRLRRRWREVIRLGPPLRQGFDVVLVARAAGECASPDQLRTVWAQAVTRAGLAR